MDQAQPEQWHIVLIDDEADIREVTSLTLEDAGYTVQTAADGAEGLKLVTATTPQIVITDIRMPRMSGLEVLEQIKESGSDTEVIVVTAFGEMDLAIQALQLDASDFITKPINYESLHLALHRARERYQARKQVRDYTALLESEQARTAQELTDTIAIQKNLIAQALDGIAAFDSDGRMVLVNPSLAEMLGAPNATAARERTLDTLLVAGEAQRFRQELAGNGFGGANRLLLYESNMQGVGDQPIPVQLSAVALEGRVPEMEIICFFRDLRELKALEQEVADQARILHQDKMMSLGRLAASVVHEINNPISGVLNYLRLMIRILDRGALDTDHQAKFSGYLELATSETDRCAKIVSNLLAFSRKTTPESCPVDVTELLERSLLLAGHKLELNHIAVHHALTNNLPVVMGDFNQLQQCLINLIFNAIDAMPNGGTLTIGAERRENGDQIRIRVSDTGTGIAAEDQGRIFEPFFTTKAEGSGVGLGLSTVYGILKGHGGTIDVESQPGKGATFFIRLPTGAC